MTDTDDPRTEPSPETPVPAPPSADPPHAPANPTKQPHTFLGRLAEALRQQNWFAVALELVIVVLGVVIGFQVNAWGAAQADARLGTAYAERLLADLRRDRDSRQLLVGYYDAVHASAERTVALLNHPAADPLALVVHAYRATEYSYWPKLEATWDEIVSSGHVGLLAPAVGEAVSDYFAYDPAADALAELKASPYRRRVRSLLPHAVQDAIRTRCGDVRGEAGGILGFRADCDLGLDATLIADGSRALRDDPAVIEGLRYQFSDLNTARANIGGDLVYAERALAALEGRTPEEATP